MNQSEVGKQNGVIYVMESNGLYKVGHTSNVKKRLQSLRCGNKDIGLAWSSKPIGNRVEIESMIHRELKDHKISGEWFDCKKNKVVSACKKIIKRNSSAANKSFDIDAFESRYNDSFCMAAGYLCKIKLNDILFLVERYKRDMLGLDPVKIKEFDDQHDSQKYIQVSSFYLEFLQRIDF